MSAIDRGARHCHVPLWHSVGEIRPNERDRAQTIYEVWCLARFLSSIDRERPSPSKFREATAYRSECGCHLQRLEAHMPFSVLRLQLEFSPSACSANPLSVGF